MEFQGYIGFKGYKGILTKAPKPIKHQTMPTAGLIQTSMLKFQGDRERKQRKKNVTKFVSTIIVIVNREY